MIATSLTSPGTTRGSEEVKVWRKAWRGSRSYSFLILYLSQDLFYLILFFGNIVPHTDTEVLYAYYRMRLTCVAISLACQYYLLIFTESRGNTHRCSLILLTLWQAKMSKINVKVQVLEGNICISDQHVSCWCFSCLDLPTICIYGVVRIALIIFIIKDY